MTHATTTYRTFFIRTLLAAALSLAVHHGAQAQVLAPELAAKEAAPADSHWGLGIGAGFGKAAYREFDDDPDVLPLLMYENRYISFFGTTLDAKLPSAGPFTFRLRAKYSGDGYEAKDSPYLAGMAERKGGVWLGGAVTWRGGILNASAEALASTGDAEGKRFKLELNRTFKSGALSVTPRIAANWHDKKYVDYYYGVRAEEVRASRARYVGKSATNGEIGIRLGYAVTPRHNLFVDFSATSLGGAIKDSPLVEKSSESSVKLGYLYNF
ncbi:MipA/OmpV family protein [Pseudoduganella umbonata]|uniref:MipA/OmpV family protein n=1 Tax=Pseudoduganella umbonata TaxID=864828 RepID=A0A4P8HK20_9BURK|nr:MipA/OmpV family protein [Pseudoduganella umbonata]MBB3219907.1 outer membrane protein [Pseudoduganella umbonata]QCP09927.1 MipA/OmpV family protein [Pseudoduganella umbonata]